MDQDIPLRPIGESSIPPPSSVQIDNDEAPLSSTSSSSSTPKTLNGLPRELRDAIYELVFNEEVLVVLGRRGILVVGSEAPGHPEKTSQLASKYRVVHSGFNSSFRAQGVDSHADTVDEPELAEMAAYGASVRKGLRAYDDPASSNRVNDLAPVLETSTRRNWFNRILLVLCCGAWLLKQFREPFRKRRQYEPSTINTNHETTDEANEATIAIKTSARKTSMSGLLLASKQNYQEAAPILYKSCTFLFEDFELSIEFLDAVSFDNLKHITKVQVYYPQEAEGTVKAITAIRDCPDLSRFYHQSNALAPNAESRLRRALVSFDTDPADDYTLAYNIATQGTSFYQSTDPNRLVSVPSSLFPSRWLFGVMCRLIVVSTPAVKEFTIWIGDTLELEFNSRRDETYEAALLQFAALGKVDALSVKKWGDAFDNSGDEDARWHEVNWLKVRTLKGVEEMIRGGEHGALDRHAMMLPDADD